MIYRPRRRRVKENGIRMYLLGRNFCFGLKYKKNVKKSKNLKKNSLKPGIFQRCCRAMSRSREKGTKDFQPQIYISTNN